jgi:hypothetical protein
MPRPSHPSCLDYSNYTWRGVQVMKFIKIHKIIILPVVLYGCETWSLTLRGKHGLKVFENRVPRRIFGPNSDEIRGGSR